jgi:hypothetical protein
MKDTIIPLLTLAAMIASAVISANKKKKEAAQKAKGTAKPKTTTYTSLSEIMDEVEQELAEEKARKRAQKETKSLGQILEELAQQELSFERPKEPETEPGAGYFEEQMVMQAAEEESAAARLAAMTYKPMRPDSVERNTKKIVEEAAASFEPETDSPADDSIEKILAQFDLSRAVIESEILTPKYQQY